MKFVSILIEWDDQEWQDSIFGSGCLSYPWWSSCDRVGVTVLAGEPIFRVTCVNPDDLTEAPVERALTLSDIAVAAGSLAAKWPALARAIVERDLDADAADAILQTAVLGEVKYG